MCRFDAAGIPEGCTFTTRTPDGLDICVDYWWSLRTGQDVYLADTTFGSFFYTARLEANRGQGWPSIADVAELHNMDWSPCAAATASGPCYAWGKVSEAFFIFYFFSYHHFLSISSLSTVHAIFLH